MRQTPEEIYLQTIGNNSYRQTSEDIYRQIKDGMEVFFAKNKRTTAVIGLSGGLDSAVVAVLAVEVLGKKNVLGVMMPSQHSTVHSVSDAVQLAENLGIASHVVPIESIYHAFIKELTPTLGHRKTTDTTEENLQARIRGTVLMAISNRHGHLVLNTSNKSELSMGYGTLYGDLAGSLMVIGDVYKTQVYELARYLNHVREIIPSNILSKEPSAELRPNQKDSDTLPPYKQLDAILYGLCEEELKQEQLVERGFDAALVNLIAKQKVSVNFKHLQVPPVVKVGMHPLLPVWKQV